MSITPKPVEMIDARTGKQIRIFKDAKAVAKELKLSLSSVRSYMSTPGRGITKEYQLRFLNEKRDLSHRSASDAGRLKAEAKAYHHSSKTKPKERICLMCNKKFMSVHNGNRRCGVCNTNEERISNRKVKSR